MELARRKLQEAMKALTAAIGTYTRLSGHHVVGTGRAKKELDLNVWLICLICC
jgi:hypothetical protein